MSTTSQAGWTPGSDEISASIDVSRHGSPTSFLAEVPTASSALLRSGLQIEVSVERPEKRSRKVASRTAGSACCASPRVSLYTHDGASCGCTVPPPGGGARVTATGAGSPTTPATMTLRGSPLRSVRKSANGETSSMYCGWDRGAQ